MRGALVVKRQTVELAEFLLHVALLPRFWDELECLVGEVGLRVGDEDAVRQLAPVGTEDRLPILHTEHLEDGFAWSKPLDLLDPLRGLVVGAGLIAAGSHRALRGDDEGALGALRRYHGEGTERLAGADVGSDDAVVFAGHGGVILQLTGEVGEPREHFVGLHPSQAGGVTVGVDLFDGGNVGFFEESPEHLLGVLPAIAPFVGPLHEPLNLTGIVADLDIAIGTGEFTVVVLDRGLFLVDIEVDLLTGILLGELVGAGAYRVATADSEGDVSRLVEGFADESSSSSA